LDQVQKAALPDEATDRTQHSHNFSQYLPLFFPGGKVRPRRDADPSPPSSAEVKNRVEQYQYSP